MLYVQADLRTLEGFNIIVGATKGLDISLLFSNAGCLLLEDYHDGQIDGLDGYIDLMVKVLCSACYLVNTVFQPSLMYAYQHIFTKKWFKSI